MSSSSFSWHWRNNPSADPISPIGRPITINAPPNTDIYRPAPDKGVFTAPYLYTTIKASRFRSVRVTVAGAWKTLYDQGGIVISFRTPSSSSSSSSSSSTDGMRFIKAGVEFFEGEPRLGVVGTDWLSDWSLSPISTHPHPSPDEGNAPDGSGDVSPEAGKVAATIEVSRDGPDGWVFALDGPDGRKRALRQLTWAFQGGFEDADINVGIYAAKPTREGPGHEHEGIAVSFSGFALEA